jgi:GT2 family glycosyltransferase
MTLPRSPVIRSDVPVIILNWNGWQDTFTCVNSVLQSGDDCAIWVVDNASTEDRAYELTVRFPTVQVMQLDGNYGWAGGYNRALQHALNEGHPYAYLLNNDTLVEPGFLSATLEVTDQQPHLAAVGSSILYAHDSRWVFFDGAYHEPDEMPRTASPGAHAVDKVNGAGMLVSLPAFAAIGGFDERLFCYTDEEEWCARARAQDWKILVAPASRVVHSRQNSDINSNAAYYATRNRFLLRRLHPTTEASLLRQSYRAIRLASTYRREGRASMALATAQGLVDGILSRYGRRRAPAMAAKIVPYLWPFPNGSVRAWCARFLPGATDQHSTRSQ